ncbi:Na/Pi cotransporter family protein [Candidatus Sumerlaeota bacterium]|nr:Na/Pi cotransporter family protein [Candidatus Sumerlaeota bacterium]
MESFKSVFFVIGGLGLFLYGMELVTKGLQRTLAFRLRSFLLRVTEHRLYAYLGGAALATLMFSGPATAMITGFVNAGLISLNQSVPLMFGANVGTTIAMQFVALRLVEVAPIAIGIGMILRTFFRSDLAQNAALAPLGFGMIFLGLELMSIALEPMRHSAFFQNFVSHIHSGSIAGLLLGVVVSCAVTSALMSSTATIAITLSLASAGAITKLEQAFPILIGAYIGTCIVAIISAMGKNGDAKRAALCHLLFNVFGCVVAIALMKVHLWIIPKTSSDLVRQIVNLSTCIQFVNGLVFLPFTAAFARLASRILPRKGEQEERTHLDPRLVDSPERAIAMATLEMQRQTRICLGMLRATLAGIHNGKDLPFDEVRAQERAVDDIKHALDTYLVMIAERQLSRRHAIQLQDLVATCNDIERIADHIEEIILMTRAKERKQVKFDAEQNQSLQELGVLVSELLLLTVASLDARDAEDKRTVAQQILEHRKIYKRRAMEIRQIFNEQLEEGGATDGMQSIFFTRYLMEFDRIIRHVRGIARAELRQALPAGET